MKLYWDFAHQKLYSSLSTAQAIDLLELSLRDYVALELYLVALDDTTGALSVTSAPTGYAPKCELKTDTGAGRDGSALAGAYAWSATGSGETAHYEDTLGLNTSELVAAFAAAATSTELDLVIEFTLQPISGEQRDSTRCTCRVHRDVIRTGGTLPTSLTAYPWFSEVVANGGRHILLKNSDGVILAVFSPPGVAYP